ncbi:hypothetical protein KIN20_024832 [Parelaphostrongylus tenuis]|uniref:Uncharacterized protein n=1 Tax=Parelaphostrongylus tenuis TaxID=148309 RepID=A0AAD5QXN9_PARTN|nr:hypothetical protein KIN20_024832 [Parelaphostrongylus tenuis]
MPSVASQLSSVDNFCAKQQLLDEYVASTKARDSLRTSQPSLIKSKYFKSTHEWSHLRRVFSRVNVVTDAFGAILLGILAAAGILSSCGLYIDKTEIMQIPSISTAIRLRENPSECHHN